MPVGASTDSRMWSSRARTAVAAALITVAALAAYANTFRVPFVFDDGRAILDNPGVRRLWPIWSAFSPQATASTVDGRPVANFTLAVNYALSGTGVWSYHALNLLIHILGGLTLFGVVRRTLALVGRVIPNPPGAVSIGSNRRVKDNAPYLSDAGDGVWLALAIALLWTLHPLQTEAVTYVIQRVESLMGLFYLLTLYCFIRGIRADSAEAGGPQAGREGTRRDREIPPYSDGSGNCRAGSPDPAASAIGSAPLDVRIPSAPSAVWFTLSFLCCLLGMATKEVMATAPVLVLLYDRTFVAGTFRTAWRCRWRLHLSLASTWLLLGVLVAGTGWNRGGGAGFDVGVKPSAYWLTQGEAVVRYLWLTVWPHPLVFDYGTFWVRNAGEAVPYTLVVVPLAAVTAWALRRAPVAGFLGAWFLGILAVTSVIPGTIQMIVEHRMYLALAAPITAVVIGLHAAAGRSSRMVLVALALGLGLLTARRNADYGSELALWSDTVAKRPNSPRARNGLAFALDHAGRTAEAIQQFEAALLLAPNDATLHDNLGVTLESVGRTAEAMRQFEVALRLDPKYAVAHNNLGNALLRTGDSAAAIGQFKEALRLRPDYAEAHYNLGGALDQAGQTAEAVAHLEAAVRLKPDFAAAHYNLGDLLDRLGRPAEAMAQYEQALRLAPRLAEAQVGLGVLLCRTGQPAAGLAHLSEAVRLRPDYVSAHFNLGVALMRAGRIDEAAAEFKEVLRLEPDHAAARRNLELLRAGSPARKSAP